MEWFVRWRTRLTAGRRVERRQDAGSRRLSGAIACLSLLGALATATWAFATNYVYDANGRLVVVTNDAGESARYVYDAMGNLTGIERLSAGDLAIFAFSPIRGAPGVQVRVQGHGFSPNPADNALSFNGVPAVVSTATGNELVTTVPATAITGPIMVAVGGNTVTSVTDFIVDQSLQPPVIQSVSPLIGAVGTAITVAGESLSPMPNQTTVRLSHRLAQPTTLTNVQLAFPIPSQTGSGKVSVSTPFGTATSAQDVVVIPAGTDPATVVQTKRIELDAPAQGFAVSETGQSAAALFDGVNGEHLTAQFSGISVASIAYSLYGVDNELIVSGTVTPASSTLLIPRLSATGTYLLLMKPVTGPATWDLAIERDKAVVNDGATFNVSTTIAGQQERLTFAATAGQRLGLGISDLVTPGWNSTGWVQANVYVQVVRPDGGSQATTQCFVVYGGCQLNLSIPMTGTYSVIVHAPTNGERTMSFKMALSSDVTGTLARDVPSTLTLERRGQNGRLAFAGMAGETVALQVAGQTTVPSGGLNGMVYYTVYWPDGTLLASGSTTSATTLNLVNLPATGNYTVFVDPTFGETLSAQLTLATGTTGGEEIDGAEGTYETAVPGQSVYLTFAATAGQRLGLGLSDLVTPGSDSNVYVQVLPPDNGGQSFQQCYAVYGGCQLNLSITMTGTYSVIVHAPTDGERTMSFKMTLSSDVTGTLARDVPSTLALERRGQNGRLAFAGMAGETVALQVAGQTTVPSGGHYGMVYYTVFWPDGTLLASGSTTSATTLNLVNLPATGTYTVFVDPTYGETLSAQLTLAAGMMGVEELDGDGGEYATTIAGQNVFLTFAAEAGQRLGLGISDLAVNTGSYVALTAYNPDGDYLGDASCNVSNNGCGLNLSIATTGVYSVVVTTQPHSAQTMGFKTTLSSDVTGTLARDVPSTLTLGRRGQNGRLTFAGTASETVALQVAGQATAPSNRSVSYAVYKPDGTLLTWKSTTSATTLNLVNLPATGNYTVFVDPTYGETLSAQLTLATAP